MYKKKWKQNITNENQHKNWKNSDQKVTEKSILFLYCVQGE